MTYYREERRPPQEVESLFECRTRQPFEVLTGKKEGFPI